MTARRELFTRERFEYFLAHAHVPIYVRAPYAIVACRCSDVNCHGWRLVSTAPSDDYVDPRNARALLTGRES